MRFGIGDCSAALMIRGPDRLLGVKIRTGLTASKLIGCGEDPDSMVIYRNSSRGPGTYKSALISLRVRLWTRNRVHSVNGYQLVNWPPSVTQRNVAPTTASCGFPISHCCQFRVGRVPWPKNIEFSVKEVSLEREMMAMLAAGESL